MFRNGDFMTDSTTLITKHMKKEVPFIVSTVGMGNSMFLTFGSSDFEARMCLSEGEFSRFIDFLTNFMQKMTVCQYEDSEIGPESWQEKE